MRDPLHILRRETRSTCHLHRSYMRLATGSDVKQDVHLLRRSVRCALSGYSRPVISVLLHELSNVLDRAVKFLSRIKLTQLKLRRIDDLVRIGSGWRSLHINRAHKKIIRGRKGERNSIAGGSNLGLNIGKAARRVKGD